LRGPSNHSQAVFGPVPSRRLGMSLGLDLVLPKTCSLDCVYCELGPTTNLTSQRAVYRDPEAILAELAQRLGELETPPDFITLAGSGEPTLHSELGAILRRVRELSPARRAVLTNATLVGDPAVRAALGEADLLVPSLDAVSESVFRRVNRPARGLTAAAMRAGLIALRREFVGEIWLEILLVEGYNDSDQELELLMAAAREIAPDRVQLNTVVRPPTLGAARPLSDARLAAIAAAFPTPAEVIAPPQARGGADHGLLERQVVEMTRRRPCTLADLGAMTGLGSDQTRGLVDDLLARGLLQIEPFGDLTYYRGV